MVRKYGGALIDASTFFSFLVRKTFPKWLKSNFSFQKRMELNWFLKMQKQTITANINRQWKLPKDRGKRGRWKNNCNPSALLSLKGYRNACRTLGLFLRMYVCVCVILAQYVSCLNLCFSVQWFCHWEIEIPEIVFKTRKGKFDCHFHWKLMTTHLSSLSEGEIILKYLHNLIKLGRFSMFAYF